jgi:hypothetical protein
MRDPQNLALDGHYAAGTAVAPAGNPLYRLVPLDWSNSLFLLFALMIASYFAFGHWYSYWSSADMNFMVVYNALLLNAHLPREYFDHPGHFSIVLVAEWFRALHAMGLLDVASFDALPPVADGAAFTRDWAALIQAGRLVSLFLGLGLVAGFAFAIRALVKDWRVAVLATFAFGLSGGLQMEDRIMRTEIIGAGGAILALMVLLIAARAPQRAARPLFVGLAGLLAALAMDNKIQAIFLIGLFPLIVPFFGRTGSAPFWSRMPQALFVVAMLAVAAAVSVYAITPLLTEGWTASIAGLYLKPLIAGYFGLYQIALAFWLGAGMIAFAALWRVAALETIAAALALVTGVALGLAALYWYRDPHNTAVVLNPLEQLLAFASAGHLGDAHGLSDLPGLAGTLVWGVIRRHVFILKSSARPTIFLEWLVIALTVIAWRRGQWRLVRQVAVLMAAVFAIDTLNMARDLKLEYFLFTDPLTIIAFALLLVKMPDLQYHRLVVPIGAALIVAHIAVGQSEPVKHSLVRTGPEPICAWFKEYIARLDRFPFCPV